MPGVVAAEVYVERRAPPCIPLTDGSKRAGHVLAFGDDREQPTRELATRAADDPHRDRE